MPSAGLERVSFWFDSLDAAPEPEQAAELPSQVDVAIVGGGFTGLWTAYYLKCLEPSLDIAVLEAVTLGFGASGRNGGWCMGMAVGVDGLLEDPVKRTAAGRLAFGGREGYLFGSRRKPFVTVEETRFNSLEATLRQMFPVLEGHAITHRWGGLMGMPTSWRPSVSFDRASGFGAAGGYVGEGVGASNLAGRIMADLVLGRDSDITHPPWVNDASERWPREPLRWLGASAMAFLGDRADRVELAQGRPSRFWGACSPG